MRAKNVAVIFAAGYGERMKYPAKPKQFLESYGKPVLLYTLERFQRHEQIDGIVLTTLKEWTGYCADLAAKYSLDKVAAVIPGGDTSQRSILLGLEKAREVFGEDAIALVHDGVRPLIDAETIDRCIQSVRQYGSAVTVSPQMETVMIREPDGAGYRIVDRDRCRVARAPQCFYLRELLRAHQRALEDGELHFVDSASLMERYGCQLHLVEGPEENIKITTALDFQVFRAIMAARGGQGPDGSGNGDAL